MMVITDYCRRLEALTSQYGTGVWKNLLAMLTEPTVVHWVEVTHPWGVAGDQHTHSQRMLLYMCSQWAALDAAGTAKKQLEPSKL